VSTPVDRLYSEATAVLVCLERNGEISLRAAAADNLRKTLLLAAASYFENQIVNSVLRFIQSRSGGSVMVEAFVRNKAVARQYHTWFEWDKPNANQFFGLFGSSFKTRITQQVKSSETLRESIKAFLDIGNERNKVIHQDFASFILDKTIEEIFESYRKALYFVERLPGLLEENDPRPSRSETEVRAYYIAQKRLRSGEPGDPKSDWLQAQTELIEERGAG